MIKSPAIAIALALAAVTQLAGPAAVAQTTVAPKATPGFSPKDLPEPVSPALVPAQTAPTTMPPAATAPSTTTGPTTLNLTDAQAKAWIDKAVYSSDDKKIGEIAAFARDSSGNVTEMHADIGGFLGMGETRIRLMPAQFKMGTDRVVLMVTADQAKALPTVKK